MANAYQVKADVVNELRNKLYYNQMEIQRLLNNPPAISHKEVVDTVVLLLQNNIVAQSSIELLENYLPAPKPQVQPSDAEPQAEDEGVKKIN